MQNLLINKINRWVISLAEEFIGQSSRKSIFWIYGKSGYGKTAIARYLVDKFVAKNLKVCPLTSGDFINLILEFIRNRYPKEWLISRFQKYDLLVFDNIDVFLSGKPAMQESVSKLLMEIIKNGKTKIVLATSVSPNKLKKLKFQDDKIYIARLKKPTVDFKIQLLKQYINQNGINVSPEVVYNTAKIADNLFQLQGAFHRL